MSVRLNLLPDLRQQKQREQSRRRTTLTITIIICSVSIGSIVLLAIYEGAQKVLINNATNEISNKKLQLQNTTGLIDALTAQQDLASLPITNAKRVFLTKFFQAYSTASPTTIAINNLSVDQANVLKVAGVADSYATVTKLAYAMAADNISIGVGASSSNQPYFTNINITDTSRDQSGKVDFDITATVGTGALSGK